MIIDSVHVDSFMIKYCVSHVCNNYSMSKKSHTNVIATVQCAAAIYSVRFPNTLKFLFCFHLNNCPVELTYAKRLIIVSNSQGFGKMVHCIVLPESC